MTKDKTLRVRPSTRPVGCTPKEVLDRKEFVALSDPEWMRKLELTKQFYLNDPSHGGNIFLVSKYQGLEVELVRRAIYDGVGSMSPWEYAKHKHMETLRKEMKQVTQEFHTFIEETNVPELKNIVRLGTEVIKTGLSRLHGTAPHLTPKELHQVASVVETCHKIVSLIEEKPTEIVGVGQMSQDDIRLQMQSLKEIDKGFVDWEDIGPETKKGPLN